MKEKLIIKNFAGIDHLEIELNKINILIGPQASGKSITAKLIFYFKSFVEEISTGVENNKSKREIDKNHVSRFINYFPKETWPKYEFYIEYVVNDSWMKIHKEKKKPIKFEYSEDYKLLIRKAKIIYKSEYEKTYSRNSIPRYEISNNYDKKFKKIAEKNLYPISTYHQFFIPAGRSFFSNIQSNIFSFLSSNKSLDPFLIEFGSFYENFKQLITSDYEFLDIKLDKYFENLSNSILSSNYIREKEKDYLIHIGDRKVNLANASSGQQEILPLLLILKTLMSIRIPGVLYIEEPEAHLFPNAQKNIIQLLARVSNSERSDFQIILTTHSPYILSSFNNLMYAGSLDEKIDKPKTKKLNKIIPKEERINPKFVSAYSLDLGGKKKNLIDKETGLISQNYLDDVSNKISTEFGKLLDLEF